MSRRDRDRPDLTEWTLPDLFALRGPDDAAARSAQRSQLQATWTGEIPVLRALADVHGAPVPARPATPAARRGRHAAAHDAVALASAGVADSAPTPAGTVVVASTDLPRRRGRHCAADENVSDAAAQPAAAQPAAAQPAAAQPAAAEPAPTESTPSEPAQAESQPAQNHPSGARGLDDDDSTDVLAAIRSTGPLPLPRRSPEAVEVAVVGSARRLIKRPLLIALAAVICLVTAGGGTAVALNKTVTITVDGQQREVSTRSGNVAGALVSAGLGVGEHDSLAPSPGTPIRNGSKISLDRGRQLTVVIDGKEQQIWTTARSADAALTELGETDARMKLSADRSRPIPLQGLAVRGATLRLVKLSDAGRTATANTTVGTVGELLAERKVRLGSHDTVSPTTATPLTDGIQVTVTRRQIVRSTEQRTLPQPAVRTLTDAKVERHTTTVTTGRSGVEKLVYETVSTNGKAGAKRLVSRATVRTPEATTTHIGSGITKPSDGWNVPWDQLAECESTSRWDIDTGNGTYGGIQFMTPTWLQYGGGQYAPRADLATKDQQIAIGERLYAAEGLAPWACARILGWGFGRYTGGW